MATQLSKLEKEILDARKMLTGRNLILSMSVISGIYSLMKYVNTLNAPFRLMVLNTPADDSVATFAIEYSNEMLEIFRSDPSVLENYLKGMEAWGTVAERAGYARTYRIFDENKHSVPFIYLDLIDPNMDVILGAPFMMQPGCKLATEKDEVLPAIFKMYYLMVVHAYEVEDFRHLTGNEIAKLFWTKIKESQAPNKMYSVIREMITYHTEYHFIGAGGKASFVSEYDSKFSMDDSSFREHFKATIKDALAGSGNKLKTEHIYPVPYEFIEQWLGDLHGAFDEAVLLFYVDEFLDITLYYETFVPKSLEALKELADEEIFTLGRSLGLDTDDIDDPEIVLDALIEHYGFEDTAPKTSSEPQVNMTVKRKYLMDEGYAPEFLALSDDSVIDNLYRAIS